MEPSRDQQDRIVSTGERPVKLDSFTEQPLLPKDERIVSANPSPDAAIIGPSRDGTKQPESSDAAGDFNTHPLNVYVSQDQNLSYSIGGYGGSTGNWDGYPHYVNPDGLHVVSPVVYNDNPSLLFHSGYGFNSEMAYGQYSPVATPMPSIMVDNQLYPPQQVPFSPSYYQQTAPQSLHHMSSAFPVSPTELITPDNSNSDSMLGGPGSGYFLHFGSFGGGNLPVNPGSSALTSPGAYPQPMGILGPYEHNVGQISQQQRPLHAYGFTSNSSRGQYTHGGLYQGSHIGGASISYAGVDDRNRVALDKGRRRDRDRDSIYISNEEHDIPIDRNRGPRASKLKGKSTSELGYSSISRNDASLSGTHVELYNRPEFVTDYENAKFYIIKSFSEDNIHKSIKYSVWASTPHGNKKLDAAYQEAKDIKGNCPVFLLFSVNGSGQFCGVAEMIGPVDFENDADYWQQDRWSGQFPVKWHLIKDVPNNQFRHILLENNDNKPVTHSRDSQEVKLEHGIEMLKVFKGYDSRTSIFDDFDFYDERERALKDRKARQRASSTRDVPDTLAAINEMSDSLAQSLQLEDNTKGPTSEKDTRSGRNETVPISDFNNRETPEAGMGTGNQNIAIQRDDNNSK